MKQCKLTNKTEWWRMGTGTWKELTYVCTAF